MDKGSIDNERDVNMAIAKEAKNNDQPNNSKIHSRKISKAIKEVTSQHSKLLKKLAE
ncbi:hypothetical protein REC12_17830 [Desulfosporosinus sp. PR]|uniref:hypothetical protein n=1 Tax=Candidatus Desulfosporosinus nitrosoreducens TaxID=3401928 RepID=UPI0027F124BE|nr:hypothetical protein [Desulfosporosinus sp. PR]MDQ7095453.1 hypothetical protein [Desulfosporosinus sp. PR]